MARLRRIHLSSRCRSRGAAMASFLFVVAAVVLVAPGCPSYALSLSLAPPPPPASSSASVGPSRRAGEGDGRPAAAYESAVAAGRAAEILYVLGGKVAAPLIASLLSGGLPPDGDWDGFWARRVGTGGVGVEPEQQGPTNGQRLAGALEDLGPTYVKFGQALGSRPDVVPPSLSDALSALQDRMRPFETSTAREIVSTELWKNPEADREAARALIEALGDDISPVAAASVGQVYKARIPGRGEVAVKVQRPGIRKAVERDAALLRTVAAWAESLPALPGQGRGQKRLIETELLSAVEEFMSRIFEELDYRREASNAIAFSRLYSVRDGTSPDVSVVVPDIHQDLCTENVLVMEWIEGTKLTNVRQGVTAADDYGVGRDSGTAPASLSASAEENLQLVEVAIRSTLNQLLVTGVLHADPHAGNLLRVEGAAEDEVTLGYLDFGLLSTIPEHVRDGLICAVAQLVFNNDVEAVACLFGELDLLPQEVLDDQVERAALTQALEQTMAESLVYPDVDDDRGADTDGTVPTPVPRLKFDKLLEALSRLVPRFKFDLPPYFINNARALSTLEGIAKSLDPSFNVLSILYPYALNRMLANPTESKVVEDTLQSLIRDPSTGVLSLRRVGKLLRDSAALAGTGKRSVMWDVLRTKAGRKLARGVVFEKLKVTVGLGRGSGMRRGGSALATNSGVVTRGEYRPRRKRGDRAAGTGRADILQL